MERSTERALKRAGHTTRLFDDKRSRQLIGSRFVQRRALAVAASFKPDFVLLGKCQALALDTVGKIIAGKPNAMWYHDPPSFRNIKRPDIAHVAEVGRMSQTFFVSGFVDEWRKLGLPAKFLPSAADKDLGPRKAETNLGSDVAFIGHDGARLAGSRIAVGLQSKGTAMIHRADLEPLDNLELFGMAPSLTLESYRQIGRNAAGYALGHGVSPVPTAIDNYARAKLIVKTTLLHARETAEVTRDADPVELRLTRIPSRA